MEHFSGVQRGQEALELGVFDSIYNHIFLSLGHRMFGDDWRDWED
jgi:hypothetical protein